METQVNLITDTLKNLKIETVEGVNYFMFESVKDFSINYAKVRDIPIRDDDVIGVGFPRSGNHWTLDIVSMILRQDTTLCDTTIKNSLIEIMDDDSLEKLDKMTSPRYMTSHLRLFRLPHQAVEKKIRIVYILRNPKDVLVSMFRMCTSFAQDDLKFTGDWNNYFELQMNGKFPWGSWFDNVLSTENFMKNHPEIPVYVNCYERLLLDPVGRIKNLCHFLGKPDALAEKIAARIDFKTMKKDLLTGKLKELESMFKEGNLSPLLHTGIIGGWKGYFTVSQSERFDRKFKELMTGSKLADLVAEYL